MIVMAVGLGTVTGPVTDTIMASVPSAEAGAGSAVNDTTRELGGAVGIALLGSILIAKYNEIVAAKLDSFGAAANVFLNPRQREILENSPSAVIEVLERGDLPGPVKDDLVHTMKVATMDGFGQAVTVMSAAVLFALFMPWTRGPSLIDEAVTDTPGPRIPAVHPANL